jgi:hypothetical protein
MKVYTLNREQVIRRPRHEVFQFFERPENLERITPESMGFVILTPRPILMRAGAILDYTVRVLGVRLRWTTLIESYDPPARFTDVAIRGPYSFWHHTHAFEETPEGTLMTDTVRYALPMGWLGRLMHALTVKRQLKHIFDYRAEIIEKLLPPVGASTASPGFEAGDATGRSS